MCRVLSSLSHNFSPEPWGSLQLWHTRELNIQGLEEGTSLYGRAYCLGFIFYHGMQVTSTPILYTALTIYDLAKTCMSLWKGKKDPYKNLTRAGYRFICIATVPVGHVAGTLRAMTGLIHPGAYYKEHKNPSTDYPEVNRTLYKTIQELVLMILGAYVAYKINKRL